MAHKKGVGSTDNGRDSNSKRLGVKVFGGQPVIPGNIIVRQRGTKFHPGTNVYMGRDFTIHAAVEGVVTFTKKRNNRTYINVSPAEVIVAGAAPAPAKKSAPKAAVKSDAKGDDLKVINGIGPAFEKRLNALGIFTYADLVALDNDQPAIEKLEENDAMTSFEQWFAWIEEAKGLLK